MIEGDNRNHSFFCEFLQSEISQITVLAINDLEIESYKIDGLDDAYWINNQHECN